MTEETSINLPEDIELYSVKTASTATSFSERYFIEHIRKENIPVVRIGKSVRIKREDLQVFLDAEIKKGAKPRRSSEEVQKEREAKEPPKRAGHVYRRNA